MRVILLAFLAVFCQPLLAAEIGDIFVKPAAKIQIDIDPKTVVREKIPDELFGFNINYKSFQEQLWDKKNSRVYPRVIEDLQAFAPAIYRYPGGLVANSFAWDRAIGPLASRGDQDTIFKSAPEKAFFGIDEYLNLLAQVDGRFLYVLNIVGNDPLNPLQESDAGEVAKKNQALAKYMMSKAGGRERYYQLGNEVDRSKYEWDADKYVMRSRATLDAIKTVDKDAKFIAFMRDFTWTYKKDKARGVSTADDYLHKVLAGLPDVKDYSLHHYYSGKRTDGRSRDLNFWLKLLRNSVRDYQKIRGEDPNIWITEHGRQMSSEKANNDLTVQYTSNLGGALRTADYLIALAQIPQVKGAVWHGLNAGPWQLFDATVKYKDLRPRPIYYGFRVLHEMKLPTVLRTHTSSTNVSGDASGYDVRAVAFTDQATGDLGLWLVNLSSGTQRVTVNFAPMAAKKVAIQHFYIAGPEGKDPDDLSLQLSQGYMTETLNAQFSAQGLTEISVPPASVSTYMFKATGG